MNFNPDNWVKAAKEAGFKYVVFTAKHHDGYTLWPSRYGDFGVKQKMNGRDLVKEVVDACHKYGLKVGLYFSPPDWHYDRLYRSFGKKGDKYYNYNHELVASIPQKPEGHDEKRIKMVRNLELSSTAATSKEGIMEILKEDYPRSDLSVGLKHAILVGQVAVGHSHIATEWIAEMT